MGFAGSFLGDDVTIEALLGVDNKTTGTGQRRMQPQFARKRTTLTGASRTRHVRSIRLADESCGRSSEEIAEARQASTVLNPDRLVWSPGLEGRGNGPVVPVAQLDGGPGL